MPRCEICFRLGQRGGTKYRPKKKKKVSQRAFRKKPASVTLQRERERKYGEDEKGELMNYGWPVNREKKRERERSALCRSLFLLLGYGSVTL